jgi:hypothetical protein
MFRADIVDNETNASRDTTERFVKWINIDKKVQRRVQKQELRNLTRKIMYGDHARGASDLSGPVLTLTESILSETIIAVDSNLCGDDNSQMNNAANKWECLPDLGSMDLCPSPRSNEGIID